jgi:hypothetical protein
MFRATAWAERRCDASLSSSEHGCKRSCDVASRAQHASMRSLMLSQRAMREHECLRLRRAPESPGE